jgi:hypothetical protein
MGKIKKSFLPGLLVLCTGCASLTKSQLNEVNAFGQLTCNFSAYPGTVVSTYNHIHQEQELYRANSLANPSAHFTAIAQANDFKRITNPFSEKIDLTLKIIDQYAQGLVLLTSNKHNKTLDTAATKFGTSLDGLITNYNKLDPSAKLPTGIGSAVAAVITLGGDIYIRAKQAEDIKQIVPMGDKIIEKMTENLLAFLGPVDDPDTKGLKYLISQEKISVGNNYQAYLGLNRDEISINKDKESIPGFIKHERFASMNDDKDCLQMLQDLDGAEELRLQCIEAINGLRKAHAKLLVEVEKKVTIKEYAQELQDYSSDIKNMYNTAKAIK